MPILLSESVQRTTGIATVRKQWINYCTVRELCLVSVAMEKEAALLYRQLVSLCSKGGFSLTKWMSNRPGVLEAIPENHRAKGIEGLDMEMDSLPVERVH